MWISLVKALKQAVWLVAAAYCLASGAVHAKQTQYVVLDCPNYVNAGDCWRIAQRSQSSVSNAPNALAAHAMRTDVLKKYGPQQNTGTPATIALVMLLGGALLLSGTSHSKQH